MYDIQFFWGISRGFEYICACIGEGERQGASQHYCMLVLILVSLVQSMQGGSRNRGESGAVTAALQDA